MKKMFTHSSIITFDCLPLLNSYTNLIEQQEQRIAQLKKQIRLIETRKTRTLRMMSPGAITKLKNDHQERVRAYIELEFLEENIAQEKAKIALAKSKIQENRRANDNTIKEINHKNTSFLIALIKSIFQNTKEISANL